MTSAVRGGLGLGNPRVAQPLSSHTLSCKPQALETLKALKTRQKGRKPASKAQGAHIHIHIQNTVLATLNISKPVVKGERTVPILIFNVKRVIPPFQNYFTLISLQLCIRGKLHRKQELDYLRMRLAVAHSFFLLQVNVST